MGMSVTRERDKEHTKRISRVAVVWPTGVNKESFIMNTKTEKNDGRKTFPLASVCPRPARSNYQDRSLIPRNQGPEFKVRGGKKVKRSLLTTFDETRAWNRGSTWWDESNFLRC